MNFDEIMEQIKNPIDDTAQYDAADIEKMRPYTILACFPMLFWIPMVIDGGNSQYGKFYANQGLIVTIMSALATVIKAVFGLVPIIGGIIGALLSLVVSILCVVTFVFCIKNAIEGRAKAVPILGQMIEVFK